jgi:ubiquinone/menaquinone biosynthesis C-methylase UbiE
MVWNDFYKFYDWEFDIVCDKQQHDVGLWKNIAAEFGDPILELGCGSGRITIPLAEAGHDITALDISEKMLAELQIKSNHLKNISLERADMTDFSLKKKFNFAFIAYSSFQLLLTLKQQKECLSSIHRHLNQNGILAMDIAPCICEGADFSDEKHVYTAEYPMDNSMVSMFTSYKIDRLNLIKQYRDRYVKIDKNGNKSIFHNEISLKECSIEYMKLLFENNGFEIENIYGDFKKGEITENSCNIIYIVRKINQ